MCVSQEPVDDFGKNICVGRKPRSYLSLYQQLLTGLEETPDDSIVYLCEHDVFYHPCHFEYEPDTDGDMYFNLNRFYWQRNTKFFLKSIGKRALSQCVAHKKPLIEHAREQVNKRLENVPCPNTGPFKNFETQYPNIDIRHDTNFSQMGPFDISDKSNRVLEVDYWGTPRMLQQKTGYRDKEITTNDKLHSLLNMRCSANPVLVKLMKRKHIARYFNDFKFKKGAEIGVRMGKFSRCICENVPGVKLLCIDDYRPGPQWGWDDCEKFFGKAQDKLKQYDVEHIKKSSLQAARDVPDGSLDFVYIDASHEFDDVMQDLIVWTQKVRRGGIVSGHDYDHGDVRCAVDSYCQRHKLELFATTVGGEKPDTAPSWFFAKK